MKKIFIVLLCVAFAFSAISCSHERTTVELVTAFIHAYHADGIIYSPTVPEGEDGYIDEELFDRIYVHTGVHPADYSIFLSSHTDSRSECGAFNCRDAEMLASVTQMCEERVRLLDAERGFVVRSGMLVFYSTMSDGERARRIWNGIIGR